ncbi:hypothetical protein CNMCM6106_006764 [Aspergillus hiratsukae]|uniref:Uncharacterized protein n=1 Tax=Aspergillus hiratsukae TaxID=1194566 RepID=A0A8H6QH62_9EURO|nr:hypothetical protein CNMCM6106_006764 [Aspergillus hiratsukae]
MTIQKTTSSAVIESASFEKLTELHDDVNGCERHRTVMLDPVAQHLFAEVCTQSPHKPHMVLSAIWAVVLNRFTETDNAKFALFGARQETKLSGLYGGDGQTYCITLGPGMGVRQIMSPENWQVSDYAAATTTLNTALFVGSNVAQVHSQRLTQVIAPERHKPYVEDWANLAVLRLQFYLSLVLEKSCKPWKLKIVLSPNALILMHPIAMASAVSQCLIAITTTPDATIEDIDLFSSAQAETIMLWQDAVRVEREGEFLFDIFHQRVLQSPTAIAIDAWDGQWTYQELDKTACQIAAYLQQTREVSFGVPVLVCFEKSGWSLGHCDHASYQQGWRHLYVEWMAIYGI